MRLQSVTSFMDCKSNGFFSIKTRFVCCRSSHASARSWRLSPSQRTVSIAFFITCLVIVLRPRIDVPKGERAGERSVAALSRVRIPLSLTDRPHWHFSTSACLECVLPCRCRRAHLAPLVLSESRRVPQRVFSWNPPRSEIVTNVTKSGRTMRENTMVAALVI